MKKVHTILALIALLFTSLLPPAAQADVNLTERFQHRNNAAVHHPLTEGRNAGSCKRLTGDVELTVVLVSINGRAWSLPDLARVRKSVTGAIETLHREAEAYGIPLRISAAYYRGEGSSNADAEDWDQQVLQTVPELSNRSFSDWYDRPLLFCLNVRGRSYAVTTYSRASTEHVIFYAENDAGTVRHELLHLYGAEDYYYHQELKAAAMKHFPNSVMLESEEHAVTDSFTAYLVGWTERPSESAAAFMRDTEHLSKASLAEAQEANRALGFGTYLPDP